MKRLLTSCFGLGRLPLAPGTWGSIPPVIIFILLCYLSKSPLITSLAMVTLAVASSVVCVKFAPSVIELTGKTDPGEVVADEFAGQAVTLFFAAMVVTGRIWSTAAIAFVLFRIFDIIKPWPIRRVERLPAGWGILCDDLLAGVYAAVVLFVCVKIWDCW